MMPGNEIAVLCLTRNGRDVQTRLSGLLEGCRCYAPAGLLAEPEDLIPFDPPLSALVTRIWQTHRALIFIMAAGIVVRVIAPLIKDKRTDPAVLVIDEKARHVISLLSVHLGGANALTTKLAQQLGADPVITTATDLSGLECVELWAEESGLVIGNWDAVKAINAALVNGERVGIFSEKVTRLSDTKEQWVAFETPDGLRDADLGGRILISNREVHGFEEVSGTLVLRPRNLVLGIGCNRGTSDREILDFVGTLLRERNLSLQSVARIATIDAKRDEQGLHEFARSLGVPVVYFTRDELNAMPDGSGPSEWARKELGVKGVCEQAAMKGAGTDSLIVPKTISGNVTAAVAESAGVFTW